MFMTYVGHFLYFLKAMLQKCLKFKKSAPWSSYNGRVEIGVSVSALSAGAYTPQLCT
jgi:hypothetical protein